MGLCQVAKDLRQQKQLAVGVAAHGEGLDILIGGIFKAPFCPLRNQDHISRVPYKNLPGLGQRDRPGGPLEQLDIQLRFQGVNLMGHRRLGDIEQFGGPRKIEGFRYGQKTGQLKGIHRQLLILLINFLNQ